MREDELTPLEESIARRLDAYSSIDVRPSDSLATARQVMARPRGVEVFRAWAQLRPTIRAAIALAALAGLLVFAALVGGQLAKPSLTALPSASAGRPTSTVLRSGWIVDADWVADAHGFPGAADPLRLRLSAAADGQTVTVAWGTSETESLPSTATASVSGMLDLVTTQAGTACAVGDVGQYKVEPGDGLVNFVAVREACDARRLFLDRSWVRALDSTNEGGRGVLDRFLPGDKVLVSLPTGHYLASVSADAASLTDASADRTLIVIRNPIGLADPCSSSGGAKVDVESSSAALSAYLDTLPGLTVQSEAIKVDGRSGLKLTIPTTLTDDCPGGRVAEWTPRNAATNTFWFITQGDTDRLYLIDIERPCAVGEGVGPNCTDVYLVQWLGSGVTDAEEHAIVDSLAFRDLLPSD